MIGVRFILGPARNKQGEFDTTAQPLLNLLLQLSIFKLERQNPQHRLPSHHNAILFFLQGPTTVSCQSGTYMPHEIKAVASSFCTRLNKKGMQIYSQQHTGCWRTADTYGWDLATMTSSSDAL